MRKVTTNFLLSCFGSPKPAENPKFVQFCNREVVQELLTEFELLVDSTEQHRERPGEYKEQKKFFSGKKKKHTFKNQFVILPYSVSIIFRLAVN